MKICPRCQKTYSDDNLNFCLDDGATLVRSNTAADSIPATVAFSQPRPTDQNQQFGGQPNFQNQNAANQFSMQPPPKKSKGWLWAVGIIGGLMLLCGGGFVGFVFWAASLDNSNTKTNSNYSFNTNPRNTVLTDDAKTQKIDLSKWVDIDTSGVGITEFKNGEFVMSSKEKRYYYVLVSTKIYQTENATTKVTVRNIDEQDTPLGFGLIVNSNPTPLIQDYAFLIDSENKKYRVVRHEPQNEINVIKWTYSTAIKGGDEKNVLEVRDQNKKMNFYINGQFITAVDNTDGYSGGVPGLYTSNAVPVAFSDFGIIK